MHPASGPEPDSHWLEDVVAEAIEAFESDGEDGLAAICSRHPEEAARIRRIVTGFSGVAPRPATPFPDRLGDFRLLRRLGVGGMGVVFEAEQQSLGRRVAVKIVRPELLYFEGARERFRREIEAVARLQHPAIVPVLQSGDEGGVPFFAMELVVGASFADVTARLAGRDPAHLTGADLRQAIGGDPRASDPFAGSYWETCVRLLLSVCEGMIHAHRRGIVHRDLKPSNVMLTADGRAMVVDFGLAHVSDRARLTQSGSQPGSPAYMAPEQLRGEATDERADVYSLAATLHEALTLKPPFPIADPEQLRKRVLEGTPTSLREGNRAVPCELVLVLQHAMDRDSARRYRTMTELAADLQAVLSHRRIQARRLPVPLRCRRFLQRHPTASVGVAALALLVALVPAALLWQETKDNRALTVARDRAEGNYGIALEAIDEMLVGVGSERLRHLPEAQRAGVELVERALEYFDRLANQDPSGESVAHYRLRALTHLAPMQLALGQADDAVATARAAILELGGTDLSVPAPLRVLRAALWRTIAEACARRQDRDGLEAAALRIIADLDGLPPGATSDRVAVPSHLAYAEACLADVASMSGNAADEEEHLRRAVTFSEAAAEHARTTSGDASSTVEHLCNLAAFLRRHERLDEAAATVDEADGFLSALTAEQIGPWRQMMLVARIADEAAQVHSGKQDWERAEEWFRRALATRERQAADFPDLIQPRRLLGGTRNNFARMLIGRDRMAEAAELLRLAVADQRWVLARDPADRDAVRYLGSHLQSLGVALRELQAWDELGVVSDQLGALPGSAGAARAAARNLLRCAEAAEAGDRNRLLQRALEFLLESERRGWGRGGLDDELYEPLRELPEFEALRERIESRR